MIGKNIKKYRQTLLWKDSKDVFRVMPQKALADVCNVSEATIYYWETNRKSPTLTHIMSLCICLGVTPNMLFEGVKDGQGRVFSPKTIKPKPNSFKKLFGSKLQGLQ